MRLSFGLRVARTLVDNLESLMGRIFIMLICLFGCFSLAQWHGVWVVLATTASIAAWNQQSTNLSTLYTGGFSEKQTQGEREIEINVETLSLCFSLGRISKLKIAAAAAHDCLCHMTNGAHATDAQLHCRVAG